MSAEALALAVAVRAVVIIIQAALADADHLGVLGAGDQGLRLHIRVHVRFMRMHADRRHDVGLTLGGGQHRVPFAGAGGDVEHRRDAGGAGAGEHAGLIIDQAGIVEVAVAVDEHGVDIGAAAARKKARGGADSHAERG
jgi:hypothetical protein